MDNTPTTIRVYEMTPYEILKDIIELEKEMKQLKWYEFKKKKKYKYVIAFNEALYDFKLYESKK